MQFTPYLNFNGDCDQAFAFYQQLFGGEIVHRSTFAESPGTEDIPAEFRNGIMHIHLQVDGFALMGSDAPANLFVPAQGLWVSLKAGTVEEGRRLYDALAEGGRITMPFGQTFWSSGFGMVTDRFGTPWMVNVYPE